MNNNLKETMRELMLTPKEHLVEMMLTLVKKEKRLTNWLENMLDDTVKDNFVVVHVKDVLERIKSNND